MLDFEDSTAFKEIMRENVFKTDIDCKKSAVTSGLGDAKHEKPNPDWLGFFQWIGKSIPFLAQ